MPHFLSHSLRSACAVPGTVPPVSAAFLPLAPAAAGGVTTAAAIATAPSSSDQPESEAAQSHAAAVATAERTRSALGLLALFGRAAIPLGEGRLAREIVFALAKCWAEAGLWRRLKYSYEREVS